MTDTALRLQTLPSGRQMAYMDLGPPSGRPILYCHGFPSSRLEACLLAPALESLGVRIIAPDRPGYGHSTPMPGRTLGDFAADAAMLLSCLELPQVAVLGVSGGGPYALSLVSSYPSRVTRVGLVGALGPPAAMMMARAGFISPVRWAWDLVERVPSLGPVLARSAIQSLRFRSRHGMRLRLSAPADRDVLLDPFVRETLGEAQREGLRQGGAAAVQDLLLYIAPWGFCVADILASVTLWHGQADRIVPVEMARHLAATLPCVDLRVVEGEGHYSLPIRYREVILSDLVSDRPRS